MSSLRLTSLSRRPAPPSHRTLSTTLPSLARANRYSTPPRSSKESLRTSFTSQFYSKHSPPPRPHDPSAVIRPPKSQERIVASIRRLDVDSGQVREGAKPDPRRFGETGAGRLLGSIGGGGEWPPPRGWKGKGPISSGGSSSSTGRANPYLARARPVTTPLDPPSSTPPPRATGWRTERAPDSPPLPWSRTPRSQEDFSSSSSKPRSPTSRSSLRSLRATTSSDYASPKTLGIHLRRAVLDDRAFDLAEARERVLEAPIELKEAVGVWNVLISIAFTLGRGREAFELYNEVSRRGDLSCLLDSVWVFNLLLAPSHVSE